LTQPTKLSYAAGEALDLNGLTVRLTFNDGSFRNVAFANFAAEFTAEPTNGTALTVAAHNGKPVKITHTGGKTVNTSNLTVTAAADIIDFDVEQTGGVSGTADSTAIKITFAKAVTGLTAGNITLAPGTGQAVKGTLTGSGTVWTLALASVGREGIVNVSVASAGISAEIKPVTVFKDASVAGTKVTFEAIQLGGASGTADSTGIQITFSDTVTGLTAYDIAVTNGTGAIVTGALSGSGKVYTLGVTSVLAQGSVTVAIGDFGTFEVTTKPAEVDVYKNDAQTPGTVRYGDIDGDGTITYSDLISLFRYFARPNISISVAAADVNADGTINYADLILFYRYFAQPGTVLGRR
jgi:hypothetical protein